MPTWSHLDVRVADIRVDLALMGWCFVCCAFFAGDRCRNAHRHLRWFNNLVADARAKHGEGARLFAPRWLRDMVEADVRAMRTAVTEAEETLWRRATGLRTGPFTVVLWDEVRQPTSN